MKVMITGDRSGSLIYPGLVAVEIMRALGAGHRLVTGENAGVEEIVRMLAAEANLTYEVVVNPTTPTPEGKVDWDARHSALEDGVHVVAIHADPQASSVVASLLRSLPEERVTLRTPVDLLA